MKIIIPTLLLICSTHIHARIVEQCELAVALVDVAKVSRTFVPHLVCAAEQESARNTAKVRDLPNNTKNYGIFQINSRDCNICGMTCDKLVSNTLNDSVLCAKKIFEAKGLQYWPRWMNFCKQQRVPDLTSCFDKNPSYPNSHGIPAPVLNTVRVNRNTGGNLRGRSRRFIGV